MLKLKHNKNWVHSPQQNTVDTSFSPLFTFTDIEYSDLLHCKEFLTKLYLNLIIV